MRLPLGPQLKNIEQEAELEFRESIQNQMNDERRLREESDEKEHKFTLKWNRINLTVALIGVLFEPVLLSDCLLSSLRINMI